MKVFDVTIGGETVIRDMDPFSTAGQKLLPGDEFLDLQVRGGKLYVDGKLIKDAIKKPGVIVIGFNKGRADNPKVNAILLVKGGFENTHKGTYEAYKESMIQL